MSKKYTFTINDDDTFIKFGGNAVHFSKGVYVVNHGGGNLYREYKNPKAKDGIGWEFLNVHVDPVEFRVIKNFITNRNRRNKN